MRPAADDCTVQNLFVAATSRYRVLRPDGPPSGASFVKIAA